MATAYVTHPRFTEHDLPGHPENAGRIRAIWREIDTSGLADRMTSILAEPAPLDLILSLHTPQYLDSLKWVTQSHQATVLLNPDTYFCPTSLEIAQMAVGGVTQAVDYVLAEQAANALAVIRPPGHHAGPGNAMGFCLLGNIALAARHAQQRHQLERILIVDFDVHHGNGTQEMLYDDPKALFVSTHQYPFYPGTGAVQDTGTKEGRGYTVNIPLSAGHGDTSYAAVYETILWPLVRRYQPELILVSAGFDAHWDDPLANMRLSLTGYAQLTRELIRMAEECCAGRIVFVLEGGYHLQVLAHGVRNIAHALLGETTISDPFGPAPARPEPLIMPLLAELQRLHGL